MAHGGTSSRGYAGNWNLHHNDIRNLTAFCSTNVFKKDNKPVPLTWQIFDAARQALRQARQGDLVMMCVDDAAAVYREVMAAGRAGRAGVAIADPGEFDVEEG